MMDLEEVFPLLFLKELNIAVGFAVILSLSISFAFFSALATKFVKLHLCLPPLQKRLVGYILIADEPFLRFLS